jgi:hypothetical protein
MGDEGRWKEIMLQPFFYTISLSTKLHKHPKPQDPTLKPLPLADDHKSVDEVDELESS